MLRVFISSTSKDLKEYRAAVKDAVLKLEMHPVMMEHFPAMDADAVEACHKLVVTCDLFVGIYAHRYGYIPQNETKSITELEYDWAVAANIPRHIFVVAPNYLWPDGLHQLEHAAELEIFKSRVGAERVWDEFTTPDSLVAKVTQSLANDLDRISRERRQQRRLVVSGIIAIASLLILTIMAIILTAPNEEETGIAQADRNATNQAVAARNQTATATLWTPTPTITPSPTPTFTPTPTPERMPVGFNVIVAGFGYKQEDGTVVQSTVADDIGDIVYASLTELPEIDHLMGWRDYGVQHLLASDPVQRETRAAHLAEMLNADVVIYGIVSHDGMFNLLEPEFYITAEYASLEPELVGSGTLGTPVEFLEGAEGFDAVVSVQKRLKVMESFLRGLSLHIAGDFAGAERAFEEALNTESDGLEVLYIFAGNAAIREPNLDKALELYNAALATRPDYSRALVGRAIALYQLALKTAGDNPPPYDPALVLPYKTYCSLSDALLPAEPQLLAALSLICYQEASLSSDKPPTADIDVKVAFGQGQVNTWLSLNDYGNHWDIAADYLQEVIRLYNKSEPSRQTRIRAITAHANAWLGLRLLVLDGSNIEKVQQAADYYLKALDLLKNDVNREYNQTWINTYQSQVDALANWITTRVTVTATRVSFE